MSSPATESDDLQVQSELEKYVDWQKLPSDHFIYQVERGRLGHNIGMENGMPALSKYLYGTHRGRYYLLGSDSGCGKTTIGDFMFILNAWAWSKARQRRLHIFYYSFEISKHDKRARWASYFIKLLYGEDVPAEYIVGRITGMMVTDRHMQMIRKAYDLVDDIMESIVFVEDPVNPTRMFHDLVEHHYEKIGTVTRGPAREARKKGPIKGYTPKPGTEEDITMVVCDHLALAMNEQGFDTKQTMDLWSKYTVALRNIFGMTAVYIQQFNTEITSVFRTMKKGEGLLAPQRIDFGDSRYTFRDADVVLGLLKPFQYDVPLFHKYDISKLLGYFIALYIMKNRYGPSQRMLPIFLNPVSGVAYDLPLTPSVDIAMQPFYDQAAQLEKLTQLYCPKPAS